MMVYIEIYSVYNVLIELLKDSYIHMNYCFLFITDVIQPSHLIPLISAGLFILVIAVVVLVKNFHCRNCKQATQEGKYYLIQWFETFWVKIKCSKNVLQFMLKLIDK